MRLGGQGPSGDSMQPRPAESNTGESLCLPELNSRLKSYHYGRPHPSRALTQYLDKVYFPNDEQRSPTSLICDSEGKGEKGKLSNSSTFTSKWKQLDDVTYGITVT